MGHCLYLNLTSRKYLKLCNNTQCINNVVYFTSNIIFIGLPPVLELPSFARICIKHWFYLTFFLYVLSSIVLIVSFTFLFHREMSNVNVTYFEIKNWAQSNKSIRRLFRRLKKRPKFYNIEPCSIL